MFTDDLLALLAPYHVDAFAKDFYNPGQGSGPFPTVYGDCSGDLTVHFNDIDALGRAMRSGATMDRCDLNGDSIVGLDDLYKLTHDVLGIDFGDANLDQRVDRADLSALLLGYGATGGASWSEGDFNQDGRVDMSDVSLLQGKLGAAMPSPPAAVIATPLANARRAIVVARSTRREPPRLSPAAADRAAAELDASHHASSAIARSALLAAFRRRTSLRRDTAAGEQPSGEAVRSTPFAKVAEPTGSTSRRGVRSGT